MVLLASAGHSTGTTAAGRGGELGGLRLAFDSVVVCVAWLAFDSVVVCVASSLHSAACAGAACARSAFCASSSLRACTLTATKSIYWSRARKAAGARHLAMVLCTRFRCVLCARAHLAIASKAPASLRFVSRDSTLSSLFRAALLACTLR